jgi:hypothetical protein
LCCFSSFLVFLLLIVSTSMKRLALSLCIALIFFSNFTPEKASAQQGLPVDGRDFYVGYVYPSFNKNPPQAGRDFHGFFGVYALISSYDDNTATLSYFDDAGNESGKTPIQLSARQGKAVPLSTSLMQLDEPGDKPQFRACHITAKKPINVQYFSTGACSGGSYLSIPTPALGKNYVIPSYNDNPGNGAGQQAQAENAGGFFLIMAAFDATNVTITPNGLTAGNHPGVNSGKGSTGKPAPYTVSLQRGQCYWVKGDGSDDANDLSGSTVTSDKPIGVLAGHEDAFLGEAPSSRLLEGRDFMIEQVIPAEYWDSTGYVSIPLYGTQPVDETASGYGVDYRVYTNNPKGARIEENDCNTALNDMSTSLYAYPTPEKSNVGCPIELHSTDGHKFGVMAYQLRDQGTKEPYPAESMMSIVPMSRWRTSYLFYVPANTFEILQDYFINIIGEKNDIDHNIVFSQNGGNTSRLSSLGSQGAFINIPNHQELKGVRYRVAPGSYYITNPRTTLDSNVAIDTMLRGSFIVYHYGMRAIDPDRDLGDFCGDDFFFSYALPIGMTVSAGSGNPVVKVDTLCSSWHVCVHDSVALTSVTLIDDPNGNVYGRPGKSYKNVYFDLNSDPNQTGEIVFNGNDTSACFDVLVSNPFDTAYAPLYIVDKNGHHLDPILELRYKAPSVKELLQVPNPPNPPTYIKVDTLQYGLIRVGASNQVCSTLVFINNSVKGANPFHITGAAMQKGIGFKITSTTPTLPVSLKGGDTLQVQVCFTATDTTLYSDSVVITTDCFNAPLLALGKGGTPLIYATDFDFGKVSVGTTKCGPVIVENRGNMPFLLTKNWLLHNTTIFSMDPTSAAQLPVTLQPGGAISLNFCYSPTVLGPQDSTTVDWNTDIESPYTNVIKSWSYLKGTPIKAGLIWDRPTQLDSVICEDSLIRRVNLINNGNAPATQIAVFFNGPDAAEYSIVGNQRNYVPLQNFSMNPGDTLWVDVKFKADLTKGYAPRHADLLATSLNDVTKSNDTTLIKFTGLVQHAVLTFDPQLLTLGFITKGVPATGFVTVINTGDAPFVIKSTTFPNPPITGISVKGKALSPGDTIFRGDTISLTIDIQLDTYTDTTINYELFSDHACGDYTASVQAATSQLKVLATAYPAPDVFVGCREHDSTVIFVNKGSYLVTLDSVDLSGITPAGQFDLIDSKGNRGSSLTIGKKLLTSQGDTIGIVYHPSVSGPASGTIRFIFDSAGTKFVVTTQATGNGIQLRTTLSAAQASGQPYVNDTRSNFTVPISLANTPLPPNADARYVTFRLTYLRDVVNFSSAAPAPGFNWTTAAPTPVDPGAGTEYLDFDVTTGNVPITNLSSIVQIQYQPEIAVQMATPFTISNVIFYNSKHSGICYIATDTIPAVFIPVYLCGDTTLHKFLSGTLPTRISMLSPSVLTENETPILYYSINRSDLPVKVELYNVLGELVRTVKSTTSQPAGDYKLPIGTLGLSSGNYIIRLTTPISSESTNFILQK